MEELSDFFKQLKDIGEELIETATHRTKISTLFDIFTENVIPTFVSEKDLKEYYEKRMEELNDFIYNL